jgi:hypothetical protein
VFLHPCVALLIMMGNARIAGSRDDSEGSAVEDRRPQDSRRSDRLAEVFQITQFGGRVQGVHHRQSHYGGRPPKQKRLDKSHR